MSEIDYTLRDYRYPNEGYDGCETFAGVLRTFFPRWCADGKAAGLPKSWLPATAEEYAMHYLNRILPLLDPNKPMHMYEEADFNGVLEQLWNIYHFSDSTLEHYRNLIWIVYKAGFESGLYPDNIFWGEVYDPSEHTDTENEEHRVRIRTRLRKSLSREENLRILEWFHALDPETASGEEVGLLIMYFHGARNNEACGMNYGHLYRLPKYPDLPLIDLIQTTQINSSRVKAGGKTGNAPRTLLGMLPFVEFLEKDGQPLSARSLQESSSSRRRAKGKLKSFRLFAVELLTAPAAHPRICQWLDGSCLNELAFVTENWQS